jgi:hypothetical protein
MSAEIRRYKTLTHLSTGGVLDGTTTDRQEVGDATIVLLPDGSPVSAWQWNMEVRRRRGAEIRQIETASRERREKKQLKVAEKKRVIAKANMEKAKARMKTKQAKRKP